MKAVDSLLRLLDRELPRKCPRELLELRQLVQTALDALQHRRNEFQVVQPPALDGLPGKSTEYLQRSLQKRLEVALAQITAAAKAAVVREQLHLCRIAQDWSDAAVPEERGHVVRVRPHPQIL